MSDPISEALFERALRSIPGGVNSPVRAFRAVGGTPIFAIKGEGAYLFGADGRRYVDWVGSWGPLILGHAHPAVVAAATEAISRGTTYGVPTELEVRFAERLRGLYESLDRVRAVSSGTEATMSALRAARGFTGRDVVVKFEGCYHGHADFLLVKAGSGAATLGVPDSAGVPAGAAASTWTLPYNDAEAVRTLFASRGHEYRGRHRRTDRRQHGCRPARDRVSRDAPRRMHAGRCRVRLRRGHDGMPCGPIGCSGAYGLEARYDLSWQDCRRRISPRRIRRKAGDHGNHSRQSVRSTKRGRSAAIRSQ